MNYYCQAQEILACFYDSFIRINYLLLIARLHLFNSLINNRFFSNITR